MYKTHPAKLPYKISALLYIMVLIIPLGFYSTYHSFDTINEDSKVLQQTGWMQGLLPFISDANTLLDDNTIERVDHILSKYSLWITDNKYSEYYIGTQTLEKDFVEAETCWSSMKEKRFDVTPVCTNQFKSLSVTIQEIVKSKQKHTVNLFYISLSLTMLVILFSIYSLRLYMKYQMKKHAIHDEETGLFNQKYFNAELHTRCAGSVRHNYPLSMLLISLDEFNRNVYDKKTQSVIFKQIGEVFYKTTRESDIACRYSESQFAILMPFTTDENAQVLEKRIKETLNQQDFNLGPKQLSFSYAIAQYDGKETDQEFIQRVHSAL